MTTKHPSDPTGLRHVAPRELGNLQVPSQVLAMSLWDDWVVMGAAGLRSGWNASGTTECGETTTCASALTWCRTMAAAIKVMK